ncbi:MAG: P-loop NTPase [Chitinivibrionales bacterium]|nr:P-loop NTPase [Chitinivibrionales bacterium]
MNRAQEDRIAQKEKQDRQIKDSLAKIGHTILVMSGKGGVGKSSIAVNIAAALAEEGFRVGLMDVDIHGPSIPQMLGIPVVQEMETPPDGEDAEKAVTFHDNRIFPAHYSDKLSVVSIECMLESRDTAVIWRGPLKIGVIRQFFSEVEWGELDYLVIDSPPGTGDEPLTVAQTVPDASALIVTTPQRVSLRDVRKSINFCRQVNLNISGLVENLSGFYCPGCNKQIDLFKTGGGEQTAREMNVPFLGSLPIFPAMVEACDEGVPGISKSKTIKESFAPIVEKIREKME